VSRRGALALALFLVPLLARADLRTHLHRPRRGLQVRLSPFPIAAQREREVCQAVTLPNRHAMDVDRITIKMPSGSDYSSHHFAIFIYDGDPNAKLPTQPTTSVGCVGVGERFVGGILAFVQRPAQRIKFPDGVGVQLKPHQTLLLNSHYINGSPAPLTIDVAINFHAARKGSIRHHARSFQLGTTRINVPAGGTSSSVAEWPVPFPMNVVWLSTHSHKHTTAVDVDLLRGSADPERLVETLTYSEPTFHYYSQPPLRLTQGDSLRWTCAYRNTTTGPVHFGVTSEDEMCFAVGFFYPDADAGPLPPVPLCLGDGNGLVCPFN
jgi:hypothetical protein